MSKGFASVAACAVLSLMAWVSKAADAPTLDLAAQALGVDRISSLEFEASGRYFQFTQAPAPDLPWPPFDVSNYLATLDFSRAAVHAKYRRVQVVEPGRARPYAEQTMDQYSRNGFAWNLSPGPLSIPTNLAERNAELWASPQGFIKAARAHAARLTLRKNGDIAVSFALDDRYRYEGLVSAAGDVLLVRSVMDAPVLGDTPIEFRYSEYRDFNGVRFPARIERLVANLPWYDLHVGQVRVNGAAEFGVPAEVSAHPIPSVGNVEITELAPGVLFFGGTTHNSVVIDQADGIVVVEAPLNEQRSDAVIAKIHERFPGRNIRYVINTHAHFDHAGGLRTYVDEGATVITHERNAIYYTQAWTQPRRLNPDRLSRSRRQPKFLTFTDVLTLPDGHHPIEIFAIDGSGHNDAFAMVYLRHEKILIEADAWTPAPAGTIPNGPVSPLWINLDENIRRLDLAVERIAPLHGSPQSADAFRAAISGLQ